MNCKICGKPVVKAKALVPNKFAWCSAPCWKAEGVLISQKIRERKPFDWDPRQVEVH